MKPTWKEAWEAVINEMHQARERKRLMNQKSFLEYKQFLAELKEQEKLLELEADLADMRKLFL